LHRRSPLAVVSRAIVAAREQVAGEERLEHLAAPAAVPFEREELSVIERVMQLFWRIV